MLNINESVTIERDPEDVFAFVHDPANDALWNSSVIESELEDDEMRVGARIRQVSRFLGRKMDITMEVTAYDPPKRSTVKSVAGPFDFTGYYEVVPNNGGAEFTFHAETPSLGGFFGKIADPIAVKMMERQFRANLAQLKILLEEGVEDQL